MQPETVGSIAVGASMRGAANPWLTIVEYARLNRVTRRTVWRWIEKGAVEVTRKGARLGVRVRDVSK